MSDHASTLQGAPMVNELKPCAHCGDSAMLIDGAGHGYWGKTWVACKSCGLKTDYAYQKERAITAWNTRADTARLSELEAEVARLRSALEPFAKIGSWLGRTPAGRSLSLIGLVVEVDGINSNGRYAMKSGDFLSARAALEAQS